MRQVVIRIFTHKPHTLRGTYNIFSPQVLVHICHNMPCGHLRCVLLPTQAFIRTPFQGSNQYQPQNRILVRKKQITSMRVFLVLVLFVWSTKHKSTVTTDAFIGSKSSVQHQYGHIPIDRGVQQNTVRFFSSDSRGFGIQQQSDEKSDSNKSYGKEALNPIKDLIDEEASMREFFSTNEEWHPLFRSIASHPSVPAMSFITDSSSTKVDDSIFTFDEASSPWRRRVAIPVAEYDKSILATLLDAMQTSLIDIPVDETTKEDEYDLHFIEEGRRLLVCSRFHVVPNMETGSIESFDNLFSTSWSEVLELHQADAINTGSLIVIPGLNYEDVRRFADINLQRPLEWLGIANNFEVASLEKGGLGVLRLIHKLADIPADLPPPEEDEE
jgi:hypothetical protein